MRRRTEYHLIKKSGLFDAHYYLIHYPEVRRADVDPLTHFIKFGWKQGKNPGPLFNTHSYLETHPDIRSKDINPLVHFIQSGKNPELITAQASSLKPSHEEIISSQEENATSGSNVEYLRVPVTIKRLPRLILRGLYFLRVNGITKFCRRVLNQIGIKTNRTPKLSKKNWEKAEENPFKSVYDEGIAVATNRDRNDFVDYVARSAIVESPLVKLVAFYLPQYYTFPENDAWWGRGFTEWTNVSKAVPQFVGHYQPHLPGELGFYDLRVPEVQRRQVELARNYGVYGFCFHYYWFNGKRLLDRPLDQFIRDPQIDFPFCVCWANEDWTRRWDGRSGDILIAQEHSFENDKRIVHDLVNLFEHPRYIRIDDRPLLIVYRGDILQDARMTLEYWRNYSIDHGTGNPYIVVAQTFGSVDPRIGGFDAAVEFPPHNGAIIPEVTDQLTLLNDQNSGQVYRYADMASTAISRIKPEPYRRYNTVSPGWDNDARRPGNGLTFHGSTPQLYFQWLEAACRFAIFTQPESQRFVFINAWNEWAESAYIEPDRRFGYAYLQATADVLDHLSKAGAPSPLVTPAKPEQIASATYFRQMVEALHRKTLLDAAFEHVTNDPHEIQKSSSLADRIFSNNIPSGETGPLVSIIIPTYEHFEATLSCLNSLLATHDKTPFEIIIIDDGSKDERYQVLKGCKSIQYIYNEQNLGFLRSCNKAAGYASGEYVLLLNNDTMVLPGWLDTIIDTFEQNPGTGLVGAKLIYPDGRLQEAGGLMWKDANGNNFGRDDDPNLPQYNYLRDADYCSGACICVPKAIWDELHGFDELFAPAYYEDTDLAFRMRQHGYAVLYQPFSRVIHAEGVTSGTSINSGIKRYQEINRQKFYQRWKDALSDHGDGLQPSILFRNHVRRSRALLIDVCTPKPDHDSGSVDTYHYLLMLRKIGFEVTFISVVDPELVDHYVEDLQRRGIECIYQPYLGSIDEYVKKMGKYYDLVLLFRAPYGGQYIDAVRKYAPQARVVFNTVDLHFLREKRESEIKGKGASLIENVTRNEELSIMKKSDASIVVSEFEQNLLSSLDEKISSRVIPLPRQVYGRTVGFEGRKDIVFIGGYLHRPNVDAVLYFAKEIWPLIHKELSDCRFLVVGSNIPKDLEMLSSETIKVIGFVSDIEKLFSSCKLSVAPLRFGAGVKGKILTSLSYGVPCVATPVAAEGMGLTHAQNVLVGDSPTEFAAAVVRLYTDPELWEQISNNGLGFVTDKYSLSNFERNLSQLVSDLKVKPFHTGNIAEGTQENLI